MQKKTPDIIKRLYSFNYSVSMYRMFNLHLYCKPSIHIKILLFIMYTFINGKKDKLIFVNFPKVEELFRYQMVC